MRKSKSPQVLSEKQIAANRQNAKKSTGPRTISGKQRASRNSFRHGLSLTPVHDPQDEEAIREFVSACEALHWMLAQGNELSSDERGVVALSARDLLAHLDPVAQQEAHT